MSSYKKNYTGHAESVVTPAVVMAATEIKDGEKPSFHYTDNAAWDTGAQFSLISPRVVKSLSLQPCREGEIMGIGGDQKAKTYLIHIGLPSGDLIHDVEVYCSDIDDYDLLIGMDIITMTDFCITNKDDQTTFAFRIPSEGGLDL